MNVSDMDMNDEEIEIIERMGQNLMSSESESESNYKSNQKIFQLITSAPSIRFFNLKKFKRVLIFMHNRKI